jgi:sugar lactone lactonase YvrE
MLKTCDFQSSKAGLGEGVYWDSENSSLFWVDINRSILFFCSNGHIFEYQISENISAVLSVKSGIVCLSNRSGLINYDLASNSITQISRTPLIYATKKYRANDGVKLGDGLYIYGVMRNEPLKNDGALIVSKAGISKVLCKDISIPNTFIKIPNSHSLLITDSFDGVVYKITFNEAWSSIISKIKWFDLSHTGTTPDGGCISSNGRIFISIWDGFKVLELDLNGKLIQEFKLPIPRPTNCTLNTLENQLFVSSAYEGLTEHDRQKYPLSGSIVTVDVGVC